MKKFLDKLCTLLLFLVAIGGFYIGVTVPFPTPLINILFVFIAVYVLLNACGRVDKALGLGKWAHEGGEKNNPNEIQEK